MLNKEPTSTRNIVLARIINGEAATSGAPEPAIEEISRFLRNYNDPAETEEYVMSATNNFMSCVLGLLLPLSPREP